MISGSFRYDTAKLFFFLFFLCVCFWGGGLPRHVWTSLQSYKEKLMIRLCENAKIFLIFDVTMVWVTVKLE